LTDELDTVGLQTAVAQARQSGPEVFNAGVDAKSVPTAMGTDTVADTDVGYLRAENVGADIQLHVSNNVNGGLTAADRNVFSGNGDDGFNLQGARGNTIVDNYQSLPGFLLLWL
jgi:hypothetical protein